MSLVFVPVVRPCIITLMSSEKFKKQSSDSKSKKSSDSKTKTKKGEKGVARAKMLAAIKTLLPQCRKLVEKKDAILRDKESYDKKYVSLDVKDPFKTQLAEIEETRQMLRQSAISMLGTGLVKVPLLQSLNFAATVTTGVVNTPYNIKANDFVDFSSFAVLFDEYRLTHGDYHYTITYPGATNVTVPSNTTQHLGAMSYSSLSSAPTTAIQLLDDSQCRVIVPPFTGSTAAPNVWKGQLENFRYRILPGVVDDATQTGSGSWQLTTNGTAVYGYIRPYMVSAQTSSIIIISGFNEVHAEFRMRI